MPKTREHATGIFLTILVLGVAPFRLAQAAEVDQANVVIYAATPAGITAAISASRLGKTVRLLEPGRFLGGMVTGGLGATDAGNRLAIGGISRDFFRRVHDHYATTFGADSAQVKDCSDGFKFEPHVADLVFRQMLAEAKVEVIFGKAIDRVEVQGGKIATIRTADGTTYAGSVFIDASYEGDLMALAKVPAVIGRESSETYHESIAGVQARSPAHQWSVAVPGRNDAKQLLALIQAGPAGPAGSGDAKTQSYNYRLCMTDRPANQVPFPKPVGYDPARYELLARYLSIKPGVKVGQLMNPVRVPNGKTDTNNNGPISTDHIGGNWDYPLGDSRTRQAIEADHIAYVQGFCYFLANDPRVPAALHDEMSHWGLARDEFVSNNHWPHQLYVREARRMLGAFVMTQTDIMTDRTKADSVGLGSYNTDSHHVQRTVQPDGSVLNEGDFQVRTQPYAIAYRCLIPRAQDITNLFVPVCVSASHVAYGTIRMEPVYMILGEASGAAASLAIDGKSSVQDVDVSQLQTILKSRGGILSPDKLAPIANANSLDPARLEGIVVDDTQATMTGDWQASSVVGPYVGAGYQHDGGAANGRFRARFVPDLPRAGRYEVRLFATPSSNRATNAPVLIHSTASDQTIRVDFRSPNPAGKALILGIYPFEAGRAGFVEVGNEAANGHVVIDAVQFVPRP